MRENSMSNRKQKMKANRLVRVIEKTNTDSSKERMTIENICSDKQSGLVIEKILELCNLK